MLSHVHAVTPEEIRLTHTHTKSIHRHRQMYVCIYCLVKACTYKICVLQTVLCLHNSGAMDVLVSPSNKHSKMIEA